jgi:hypothetical protein
MNRFVNIIILISVFFLFGCSINKSLPFSTLPQEFTITNKIDGIYCNNPIVNPFGNIKLWDFLNPKSNVEGENLYVSLNLKENNILHAKLLNDTLVISEKFINIVKKEDNCYYTKRDFYIVPILPILWWYSNSQKRLIFGENSLIVERSYSGGGVFLIMAGGDDINDSWEYEKKK